MNTLRKQELPGGVKTTTEGGRTIQAYWPETCQMQLSHLPLHHIRAMDLAWTKLAVTARAAPHRLTVHGFSNNANLSTVSLGADVSPNIKFVRISTSDQLPAVETSRYACPRALLTIAFLTTHWTLSQGRSQTSDLYKQINDDLHNFRNGVTLNMVEQVYCSNSDSGDD